MSEGRISAGDAATAALSVQDTGEPVSVVLHVCAAEPAARILIFADGTVRGTLGDAQLDAAARDLAAESRGGMRASSRTVQIDPVDGAPGVMHTLYVETHTPTERLVIVGAGHIAVPLAALGVLLDFQVTVLDDREEMADEERFVDGVTVVRADFTANPFEGVLIDDRSYVALVTRGHRWDFDCLTRLLELPALPRYIGMIGSKRRVRAAFEALEAAHIDRDRLGRIHAPIGIDIAADTPAEIAVSIAAELVAVRRGGDAGAHAGADVNADVDASRMAPSLRDRERVVDRLLPTHSNS